MGDTATDVITCVTVDRAEEKTGHDVRITYALAFEYADGRRPVEIVVEVPAMAEILDELGVTDLAATHILRRGGVVVRVPQG